MPAPGKAWFHVTCTARHSWLPGDPRGFRSRNHRKHSTGDHKRPPPTGEHAGLHRAVAAQAGAPVQFAVDVRSAIGRAMLDKIQEQKHRVWLPPWLVAMCICWSNSPTSSND
jgi:hypothetical protein